MKDHLFSLTFTCFPSKGVLCQVRLNLSYETLNICQMNAFSKVAISGLGRVFSSKQTLVHFTQGCFVQSLFEINLMDFGKTGNAIQCVAIICPTQKAWILFIKKIKCYDPKLLYTCTTMCCNCPGNLIYSYLETRFSLDRA